MFFYLATVQIRMVQIYICEGNCNVFYFIFFLLYFLEHGQVHNCIFSDYQAETRDDEEQKIKQQEIIDLLVAAGYFRARIKGLSAFDKVISKR